MASDDQLIKATLNFANLWEQVCEEAKTIPEARIVMEKTLEYFKQKGKS